MHPSELSKTLDTTTSYIPYFCWPEAFTPEECDRIVALADLGAFTDSTLARDYGNVIDKTMRNSTCSTLPKDETTAWLEQRVRDVIDVANNEIFQLDLHELGNMNVLRYIEGGHMVEHVDCGLCEPNGLQRKLSLSIILSDPQDYDGGELGIIKEQPSMMHVLKPAKGSVVFFYSHVIHKVLPVTRGVRDALVVFSVGPKLR